MPCHENRRQNSAGSESHNIPTDISGDIARAITDNRSVPRRIRRRHVCGRRFILAKPRCSGREYLAESDTGAKPNESGSADRNAEL
jgi:hypothetical protein